MVQANISKTQKSKPTETWEVSGRFDFSADGAVRTQVKSLVYVTAETAQEAANKAAELMGVNATINRVSQLHKEDGVFSGED